MARHCDVAVIGGGLVGLASALALVERRRSPLVLEAEPEVAAHQSGHNSNVIHSGLYYKPGSLRARNCVEGREALYRFCERHALAHERCGKVVVAISPDEVPRLDDLERRGRENGLQGLRRIDAAELHEHEPHVAGVAALHVPETGIVDFRAVARKYAELIDEGGGEVTCGARVLRVDRRGEEIGLETTAGDIVCRFLVSCAGLQSDRVARMCGLSPDIAILPFRGEYYDLVPARRHLVRNLIYPVPDPRFPFLGVHFTRMVNGGVEAGPNAVLALRREGYRLWQVSPRDLAEAASFPGAWRLLARHSRTAIGEYRRSLSKRVFVESLRRLVPGITPDDVVPGGAGVRAMAVDRDGNLVDDFRIDRAPRMIHVLNAPSPAATASLSIGQTVARMAAEQFDW
jgi:L-2-hydroxyglutarate oxidase